MRIPVARANKTPEAAAAELPLLVAIALSLVSPTNSAVWGN
jgi:hypothetical protein